MGPSEPHRLSSGTSTTVNVVTVGSARIGTDLHGSARTGEEPVAGDRRPTWRRQRGCTGAEPGKIEQAEANVALLQAALDEAQRVLHAADEAQKKAPFQAERMRKVTVVVATISGVVVLVLKARHRRHRRHRRHIGAHRAQASAPAI